VQTASEHVPKRWIDASLRQLGVNFFVTCYMENFHLIYALAIKSVGIKYMVLVDDPSSQHHCRGKRSDQEQEHQLE